MAIKKGVKRKEHENLSDANVERVIGLLAAEKPISKKEACEILNISYNTTRLGKIIAEYENKLELEKKLRAANRGKPATDYETQIVVEGYLSGEPSSAIASQLYRPVDFVRRIIDQVGVPTVTSGENYTDFSPLPEQCIADEFTVGEFVWSSTYGALAEVIADCGFASDGSGARVYRIYVYQRIDQDKMTENGRYSYMPQGNFGGEYAHQRAYDLGSLKHLKQYVPDLKRIIK